MTDLLRMLRPELRFTPADGELDRLTDSYQTLLVQCQD